MIRNCQKETLEPSLLSELPKMTAIRFSRADTSSTSSSSWQWFAELHILWIRYGLQEDFMNASGFMPNFFHSFLSCLSYSSGMNILAITSSASCFSSPSSKYEAASLIGSLHIYSKSSPKMILRDLVFWFNFLVSFLLKTMLSIYLDSGVFSGILDVIDTLSIIDGSMLSE